MRPRGHAFFGEPHRQRGVPRSFTHSSGLVQRVAIWARETIPVHPVILSHNQANHSAWSDSASSPRRHSGNSGDSFPLVHPVAISMWREAACWSRTASERSAIFFLAARCRRSVGRLRRPWPASRPGPSGTAREHPEATRGTRSARPPARTRARTVRWASSPNTA